MSNGGNVRFREFPKISENFRSAAEIATFRRPRRVSVRFAILVVMVWTSALRAQVVRLIERTTEPLLKADRAWEDYCIGYTQVIRDGGVWHMWYASYDHNYRNDADGLLCY